MHARGAGSRRGATLAVVLVCFTALAAAAAFAFDYGRSYVLAAEAQTAADAAALAAARAMQLQANRANTAAPAAAVDMAARNRVEGRAVALTPGADVRFVNYAAATGAITASGWQSSDAVEVTVRVPGSNVFASVLGRQAGTIARRATAWIGNVQAATCVTPFVLPYSGLMKLGGFANWQDPSAPDITQVQLNVIGGWEASYKTIVHVPPGTDAMYLNNSTAYDNYGNWLPADFTGANSLSQYADWTAQANCASARAETRKPGVVLHGRPAADIIATTSSAIAAQCNFRSATSALCYPSPTATRPGVVIRVVYGDVGSTAGGTPVTVRAVGVLRLMCYYRASTDQCPSLAAAQVPPSGWAPYFPRTGYPRGTVVGIVDAPVGIDLQPTTLLGDTPTNVQRIVLVR